MARTVSLPQTRATKPSDCGPRARSRRGRWRALSLILVHVVAAIHIVQWMITGTTITPVEPSEAMQTLGQQALLNAGFVLFALLILGTFIFGRFFCGWGCHIVALQDLCTWLLGRLGIHPKPFRSRVLVFVPLLAFIYMFVLPTVVRIWIGEPRAPMQAHFLTDDFWERFPSWPIALLTFAVCGFIIVYLLGNKGFCTYACPYGGIFGVADQVAPGRILVTDACEGCGHCTATCTSNVRVHEEVRTWGMVVDPGCMKCMDCVSVCPKDALHFGFGKPAVAKGLPRHPPAPRRFDYTWPEEIALAALFAVSIVIMRGLYDRIPFLLALGIAAISAALVLTLARLAYVRNLRFARIQLRRGGRITRGGAIFIAAVLVWIGFLGHAGAVKASAFRGARILATAEAPDAEVRAAIGLLEWSQRWSLVPMGRLEAAMAGGYERLDDDDAAMIHYRRAVALAPKYTQGHVRLAELLVEHGEPAAAVDEWQAALRIDPDLPKAPREIAQLLVQLGRAEEAVESLHALVEARPDDVDLRFTYGIALSQSGDAEGGERELAHVVSQRPDDVQAHFRLGQIVGNQGRFADALRLFERVAVLAPEYVPGHVMAGRAAIQLGRPDLAVRHLGAARTLDPFDTTIVHTWAAAIRAGGTLDSAIESVERTAPDDRAMRYALLALYRAAGRTDDAARVAPEFAELESAPRTP